MNKITFNYYQMQMLEQISRRVRHYAALAVEWYSYDVATAEYYFGMVENERSRAHEIVSVTDAGANAVRSYARRQLAKVS